MKLHTFNSLLTVITLLCTGTIFAKTTPIEEYHQEIAELPIDDNLNSPEIPEKYINSALASMGQLAAYFDTKGFKTDLSERNGLVLMITVPASDLFAANQTELNTSAEKILDVFTQHLRIADKYKLLVAVHSDGTGSEEYLNQFTQKRADAIVDWFAKNEIEIGGIIPYGLGYDEPLNNDSTRKNRATNRRIEFYFVPGPKLIEQLTAKRIK